MSVTQYRSITHRHHFLSLYSTPQDGHLIRQSPKERVLGNRPASRRLNDQRQRCVLLSIKTPQEGRLISGYFFASCHSTIAVPANVFQANLIPGHPHQCRKFLYGCPIAFYDNLSSFWAYSRGRYAFGNSVKCKPGTRPASPRILSSLIFFYFFYQ